MKMKMKPVVAAISLAALLPTLHSCLDNDNNYYVAYNVPNAVVTVKPVDDNAFYMQLDDSTSRKLIDTYCRFQREVWSLGPRTGRSGARGAHKDADRAIRDRMARSQQLLDLRVKYFDEYRKFLTAEQVARLYMLEHEIMER